MRHNQCSKINIPDIILQDLYNMITELREENKRLKTKFLANE
jgi:hypothetical protein